MTTSSTAHTSMASTIISLESRQLELDCYAASYRNESDQALFEQMIPAFFKDMASVIAQASAAGSMILHDRIGKLMLGNIRLVKQTRDETQAFIVGHLLNHFPLPLQLIQVVNRPDPVTAMRIATSFVQTVPLELCNPADLCSYVKMMADSLPQQAFVQVAEYVLNETARLEASSPEGDLKKFRRLRDIPTLANNILGFYVKLFREERNLESPFYQLLARHEDQFIELRDISQKAPSLHDMDFIQELYIMGMDKLADTLCVEWIKDYEGTDLIAMLKDHGCNFQNDHLKQLAEDLKENGYSSTLLNLNLLDYSLTRADFDGQIDAQSVSRVLDVIVERLVLNVPEDPVILNRTGKFIDELCAVAPGACSLLHRKIKHLPYWKHSEVLSENMLQEDLGL